MLLADSCGKHYFDASDIVRGFLSTVTRTAYGDFQSSVSCSKDRLCVSSVPPNIMDEDSTTSAVAVRENQNISLVCKAEGFPAPKIMWRREDGNPITIDRKKKGIIQIVFFS